MKTVQPEPLEDQPKGFKAKLGSFVSFVICAILIMAIVVFLYVVVISDKNIDAYPEMKVKVETYHVNGVSYLVFTRNSDMQIINFTSDSIDIVNKMPRLIYTKRYKPLSFDSGTDNDFFPLKYRFKNKWPQTWEVHEAIR